MHGKLTREIIMKTRINLDRGNYYIAEEKTIYDNEGLFIARVHEEFTEKQIKEIDRLMNVSFESGFSVGTWGKIAGYFNEE